MLELISEKCEDTLRDKKHINKSNKNREISFSSRKLNRLNVVLKQNFKSSLYTERITSAKSSYVLKTKLSLYCLSMRYYAGKPLFVHIILLIIRTELCPSDFFFFFFLPSQHCIINLHGNTAYYNIKRISRL